MSRKMTDRLPRGYAKDFYDFAPENMSVHAHGWSELTPVEKRQWIERARKHYAAGHTATEARRVVAGNGGGDS